MHYCKIKFNDFQGKPSDDRSRIFLIHLRQDNANTSSIHFSKAFEETHHPKCEFKSFSRKLKQKYQIKSISTKDALFTLSHDDILIFGNPRDEFNQEEISFLSEFIDQGGSIVICLSDNSLYKSKKNK